MEYAVAILAVLAFGGFIYWRAKLAKDKVRNSSPPPVVPDPDPKEDKN